MKQLFMEVKYFIPFGILLTGITGMNGFDRNNEHTNISEYIRFFIRSM